MSHAVRSKFIFVISAVVVLVTCLFTQGCVRRGVYRDGVFYGKEATYAVPIPSKDWRRVEIRGGDLAYYHEPDESTLLINSDCRRVQDVPLKALTFQLLIGMTEEKILKQEAISLDQREALMTTAQAKVDGVFRMFKIVVLKKDNCVFDIILAADKQSFSERESDFDALVNGFNVMGK